MHQVNPGDILHGVVTYSPADNSYNMVHTNMNDGYADALLSNRIDTIHVYVALNFRS